MKRAIESRELEAMGLSDRGLDFYRNTSPLSITFDGEYLVDGVFEGVFDTKEALVTWLEDVAFECAYPNASFVAKRIIMDSSTYITMRFGLALLPKYEEWQHTIPGDDSLLESWILENV